MKALLDNSKVLLLCRNILKGEINNGKTEIQTDEGKQLRQTISDDDMVATLDALKSDVEHELSSAWREA